MFEYTVVDVPFRAGIVTGSDSDAPCNQHEEGASLGLVCVTYLGDLGGTRGSWLHLGSALAVVTNWEVNQLMEGLAVSLYSSPHLCYPVFQINKIFKIQILRVV